MCAILQSAAIHRMQELKPEDDEVLLRRLRETLAGTGLGGSSETAASLQPLSQSTLREPEKAAQSHVEQPSEAQPMDVSEPAAEAAAAPESQTASAPQSAAAASPAKPMSYRYRPSPTGAHA